MVIGSLIMLRIGISASIARPEVTTPTTAVHFIVVHVAVPSVGLGCTTLTSACVHRWRTWSVKASTKLCPWTRPQVMWSTWWIRWRRRWDGETFHLMGDAERKRTRSHVAGFLEPFGFFFCGFSSTAAGCSATRTGTATFRTRACAGRRRRPTAAWSPTRRDALTPPTDAHARAALNANICVVFRWSCRSPSTVRWVLIHSRAFLSFFVDVRLTSCDFSLQPCFPIFFYYIQLGYGIALGVIFTLAVLAVRLSKKKDRGKTTDRKCCCQDFVLEEPIRKWDVSCWHEPASCWRPPAPRSAVSRLFSWLHLPVPVLQILGTTLSSIMIHQMRYRQRPATVLTVPTIFTTAPPKYQELQNAPLY